MQKQEGQKMKLRSVICDGGKKDYVCDVGEIILS